MDLPSLTPLEIFLLLSLATWRLSAMLTSESGPWNLFGRFRVYALGAQEAAPGSLGELATCLWCCSVWIAPAALWAFWWPTGQVVVLVLAISAMAILVESAVSWLNR